VLGKQFVDFKKYDKANRFAEFDFEDKDVFQDKKVYEIKDYRKEGAGDFIDAVKSIYVDKKTIDSRWISNRIYLIAQTRKASPLGLAFLL